MDIVSETKAIRDCTDDDRRSCFTLLEQCFLGVTWGEFVRDFEAKDVVMVLRDAATGAIGGFSTLVRLELDVEGTSVPIVFSGDTAVLPEFRTSLRLGHELSRFFAETPELTPGRTPYYVLISKGWRTYRILPFFFRSFFPCADAAMPAQEQRIRDAFGTVRYPDQYDAGAGVLRMGADAPRVRPDGLDAAPPPGDEHAAFFVAANPTYLAGDELVCVARLTPDNFSAGLRRLARAGEPTLAS
jgi:hypothetical protein